MLKILQSGYSVLFQFFLVRFFSLMFTNVRNEDQNRRLADRSNVLQNATNEYSQQLNDEVTEMKYSMPEYTSNQSVFLRYVF